MNDRLEIASRVLAGLVANETYRESMEDNARAESESYTGWVAMVATCFADALIKAEKDTRENE